ncbi:DNA-3-methyladenine glycosylase [Bacillaceae bacterium SIJ1]|uniref:DNA-3-methyladenine glycosylase n=1 Tax=Litoribacterium kuwaitense TaxID=1398745 RepID=UPI0013EAEE7E|nr:DNA-3-methyladenine glycosylase [Litoribacterium kuwaitense]NGP44780.1 DNA-3-methyladenine glycosylase [Litoribacterium kuwaitense]
MEPLPRSFYERPTLEVAEELIGKQLVHEAPSGKRLIGRIVEVEAYKGPEDKASHTYNNRRTPRNEAMYGPAGHAYVYISYGLHHCMNCVTRGEGYPEGVLLRSVEPLMGIDEMAKLRFQKSWEELSKAKRIQLTNGPGKLTQALAISRDAHNHLDLTTPPLYISDGRGGAVRTSKRIGIENSGDAVHYPWRFYEEGNPYVLKKHLQD